MTIQCKFTCMSKREYQSCNERCFDYAFTAVMNDSPENKLFWQWTPAGQLNVSTVKDGQFQVGKDYYVELTLAG